MNFISKNVSLLFIIGFFAKTVVADIGLFTDQLSIGASAQGEAAFSNGTYTVNVKSRDIWGYSDSFHYVYQEISGNFTIRVKAENERRDGHETWTKTGLMIRNTLEAESAYAFAWIRSEADQNFRPAFRDTEGAHSGEQGDWINGAESDNPEMLGEMELSRIGSTFVYYYFDPDGNRILHSTREIPAIGDSVYVGLAVSSNNPNGETTSTFTNLSLTPIDVSVSRDIQSSLEHGVVSGEALDVRLTLQNDSDTPQSVTVDETLPPGFSVLDSSEGSVDGQTITWILSLPPGETSISYSAQVPTDYIDPNLPTILSWHGSVGDIPILGESTSTLVFEDNTGFFQYHADIGDLQARGDVIYSQEFDEYEILCNGENVWNTNDEFHYLFNRISGPFRMKVKVEFVQSTHTWAMAGIMIRKDLSPGSPHGTVRVRSEGMDAQAVWRHDPNGATAESSNGLVPGPISENPLHDGVIELERTGRNISFYYYDLEENRVLIDSTTLNSDLNDPIYVGLMASSLIDGIVASHLFSTLSFEAIALDADIERVADEIVYTPGQEFSNMRITADIRSGAPEIVESLPDNWIVTQASADAGTVSFDGNKVMWDLNGVTGKSTLTYSFIAHESAVENVTLNGVYSAGNEELVIGGLSTLIVQGGNESNCPFIAKTIELDGVIDEEEWDGADVFVYDRVNNLAPGHLIFGVNVPREESNTKVYLFHNENFIYMGLDVTDYDLNPDLTNAWEADGVEVSWNGNFSRVPSMTFDRETFQTIVTADGSRAIGQFVPTIESLPDGSGFFSQDGNVWNFAGAFKPDFSGYVTEYALSKNEILDPLDIKKIGFSLSTNDAISTKVRESRYALWMLDENGTPVESWNIPKNWGILNLWDDAVGVSDWPLF